MNKTQLFQFHQTTIYQRFGLWKVIQSNFNYSEPQYSIPSQPGGRLGRCWRWSLPFLSFHLLILLTCKVSKLWIKIFSTSDEEIFPMEASCYTWLNIDRNPFGSRANQCSPVGGIEAVVKAIKISGARGRLTMLSSEILYWQLSTSWLNCG